MQPERWTFERSRFKLPLKLSLPRPQQEFNVLAAILIGICVALIALRLF